MQRLIRVFCLFSLLLGASGCGVKGAPLPPTPPAYLGHGEPSYQNQDEESQKKKIKSEKNLTPETTATDE